MYFRFRDSCKQNVVNKTAYDTNHKSLLENSKDEQKEFIAQRMSQQP